MAWQKIQGICGRCNGTGAWIPDHDEEQSVPPAIECPDCKGKGYVSWGRLKVESEAQEEIVKKRVKKGKTPENKVPPTEDKYRGLSESQLAKIKSDERNG